MSWKTESTEPQWFEQRDPQTCDRCGRSAQGILRGRRNQSFGPHCKRCAEKRIKDAAKAREMEKAK